jgi:hypothetical protein
VKVNSLTITIDNFDNAAMVDDRSGEVIRILESLVDQIGDYGIPNLDGKRLKDFNGNTVGSVAVEFENDEEEEW